MDIVINTTGIERFLNLPPEQMFLVFFGNFGWLILGIIFLAGARDVWLYYVRLQWSKTHKSVLLAIDIPKGNEQSPKAVENMFTYLGGAHGTQNFYEKWYEGQYQKAFSYEIVSLEGYTQFLIRTPVEFRNLIESSVYSQYPDAEISEVDDYTETVPQRYPDEEWDVFGTEFILQNPWYFPIKTYEEFEHQMGPSETQFKDPMASLMDLCGSLRQGEQLWFQMIVIPTGFDWVKEIQKESDKILGRKKKTKPGLAIQGLELLGEASEVVFPIWGDIDASKKKDKDDKRTMLDLTPKEKRQIEGMHLKSIKLGFETKLRMVYVARKEVMNKAKVVNGFVGYIKQFMSLDLNSFKPDLKMTMTKTVYFLKESRLIGKKRRLFQNYIHRSDGGRRPFLLNIEELATLWHFPVEANVKSPLIQKAPGRKADAPSSLPIAEESAPLPADIFSGPREEGHNNSSSLSEDNQEKATTPPPNLPIV
jgi:hypothetical protein